MLGQKPISLREFPAKKTPSFCTAETQGDKYQYIAYT
jgi:hypothetical protein